MSTLTATQETAIRDWLAAHPRLAVGIGTAKQACSVAAINLALTGALTDDVPDCMSRVIGRWIIGIQDQMPAAIRNSADWRDLLPLAAGTGHAQETERLAIVMEWMWGTALPLAQPMAHAHEFGAEWRIMCEQRTADATRAAANAAYATATAANAAAYAANADAADTDAYAAAYATATDAYAAAYAANAAYADANATAAAYAANAAAYAAYAATAAAAYAAYATATATATAAAANAWTTLDPVGLLRRLIAVTDARAVGP